MPRGIHYPADFKFGTDKELEVLPVLRNFFKRDIKQSDDIYSKSDFYDDEYYYELKSRTNTYSKYPTTMITEDKIREDKKLILVFNFTDGIYYIEYDKEKFSGYKKELFSRANITWNKKEHLYIPIIDLQKLL